jgi:hypothetical protein
MSPKDQFTKYAQRLYLTVKGRRFDNIDNTDGQTYLMNCAEWTNMFLDELELETDPDGRAINWWWMRTNDFTLGTVANTTDTTLSLPSTVKNLISAPDRYVRVLQDGTPISSFRVVNADQINNKPNNGVQEDRVAQIGSTLYFSRPFKDTELSGTITGDVTASLPRVVYNVASDGTLSFTNIKALTVVDPQTLLVLGSAKNMSLPDIVQGKLSPSYAQKFNDMLQGAIARSTATSASNSIETQDYSGVTGVYG